MEQPSAERPAFLERACGGDSALRREVESLLAAHARAGGFLESPPREAATALAALSPGARLGPYEIVALLGAGGMGEVYRARDPRLGREVAVKLLPPALAGDPERLARFEQEARAASALSHANIVTVYDVGSEAGHHYLVTELLEGQTLAARIAPGQVPLRKALDWTLQIARGLAAAHERGIVHRDLKPANVFVGREGDVKILDFGVAKLAEAHPWLGGPRAGTEAGRTMGTVGYMSPEQVRGEGVDFRSDQFSFGCVLYEILTGRVAFRRPTAAQTLAAVLEDEPVALATLNPRVPQPLVWIAERCLAKEAGDRYAATRDLVRDLENVAGRLSVLTGASAAGAQRRRVGRYLARAAAGAGLFAVGAGAVWLGAGRPAPAVPFVHALTYSGRDAAPAASPDGRLVAFSSWRDGRRRIWLKQVATGSEVPLTVGEDEHPRFSPEGSWILFARREGDRVSLHRVSVLGGEVRRIVEDALYGDFAPDGRRIAFVRQFATGDGMETLVAIAGLDGSGVRELGRFPGALVQPRWSPDGSAVAVAETTLQLGEPTKVLLVDPETGEARMLPVSERGGLWAGSLAWAAPGEVLLSQPASIVGVKTGESSRVIRQRVRAGRAVALFSAPGAILRIDVLGPGRLVFEGWTLRQNLREFELRSGEGATRPTRWLTRGASADRQPIYSPDGEWIAMSSNRAGRLDLWAVSRRTGTVRRLTDDPAEDWDPHFGPGGRLFWSSDRTGHFEIWTAKADGSAARQLSRDGVDAQNPSATPDGKWVLYASGNPRSRGIVKMRADGSDANLLVAGNMLLPEVSPDGLHVAFVADLGTDRAALRVSRLADGGPTRFFVPLPAWAPAGGVDLGRCRWFPDGRGLAFIAQDLDGSYGVYAQDFDPARDTTAGRRLLVPVDPERAAESLALSPDGAFLTVGYWDQEFNLFVAENVSAVGAWRARGRAGG